MPEVLSGSMPGLSVAQIQQTVGSDLGYSLSNSRFKNAVIGWTREVLREMQLHDPLLRRLVVVDAPFSTIASQDNYDVRLEEAEGGFGWVNCQQILALTIPSLSARPLEPLHLEQYRNRSYDTTTDSVPYAWVALDQFRIKIVPKPDIVYSGFGDYIQDVPEITADAAFIDWIRTWDAVLMTGVRAHAYQWQYTQQPSVWIPQYRIYEDRLAELKMMERTTPRRPNRAVVTRALRSRRFPRDNSADVRWGRRYY